MSRLPLDAGARAAIELIARSDVRQVLEHHTVGTRLADDDPGRGHRVVSRSAAHDPHRHSPGLVHRRPLPPADLARRNPTQHRRPADRNDPVHVRDDGRPAPVSSPRTSWHELSELQRTFTAVFDPRRGTPAMLMRLSARPHGRPNDRNACRPSGSLAPAGHPNPLAGQHHDGAGPRSPNERRARQRAPSPSPSLRRRRALHAATRRAPG